MKHKLNHKIAKKLRTNLTEAEKIIWYFLRSENLGFKFRRQQPIGKYIVDFVCLEKRLIIELDGGQHDISRQQDAERDNWLKHEGFNLLRFWNNEVLENREAVIEKIKSFLFTLP